LVLHEYVKELFVDFGAIGFETLLANECVTRDPF
jgi:hypothetical protein